MGIVYIVKEIQESAGGFLYIAKSWTYTKVEDALKFKSEMEHKAIGKSYTHYEVHVETL